MSDLTVTNAPATQATNQKQQVGPTTADGEVLGWASTSKIGFYGLGTPIVKPTCTFAATSGTTVAASVAADLFTLRATLASLGLIATA